MQQTNLVKLTICQLALGIWKILFSISGTKFLKNAGKSTKLCDLNTEFSAVAEAYQKKSPKGKKLKAAVNLKTAFV